MFTVTIEAGIEPFTNSLNFASSFDPIMSEISVNIGRDQRDFLILDILMQIVEACLSSG